MLRNYFGSVKKTIGILEANYDYRNDHNVKLYNGDIGLCLAKGKVWFGNREVSTSRIPAHEPAFMMTIHKSQGSEFEHTVMVLPTEPNPVLSRELVFTGVTPCEKSAFRICQ